MLAIYNTAGSYTRARTVPHVDPHSAIALLVTALRKQDEAHSVCVTLKHTSEQNYIAFGIPSRRHIEGSTQLRLQAASYSPCIILKHFNNNRKLLPQNDGEKRTELYVQHAHFTSDFKLRVKIFRHILRNQGVILHTTERYGSFLIPET